jgi:hypothetical protein
MHWLIRYATPSTAVRVDPEPTYGCPGYETPYHEKENRWLQRLGILTKRLRRE